MSALPPGTPREKFDALERGLPLRVVKTAPKAASDRVTIYAKRNGLGKVEVLAQHPTGVPQVMSTEP